MPPGGPPCGFKWVQAKAHNKAKLIVVDPRFTRSRHPRGGLLRAIRTGGIIFLGGVIKYMLDHDEIQHGTCATSPTFSHICARGLRVRRGKPVLRLHNADKRTHRQGQLGLRARRRRSCVKTDPTLAHPRSGLPAAQEAHYSLYRREMVGRAAPRDDSSCRDHWRPPRTDNAATITPARAGLDAALDPVRRSSG